MKKLLVVGLAAGLVAGSLLGPAHAKKKKPKPKPPAAPVAVDLKFFLRQDNTSDCTASHEFLSLADGADLSCAYTGGGAMYEAYYQANNASEGAVEDNVPVAPSGEVVWATEDGVPFVLDGSKNITGEITIHGADVDGNRPAAGRATIDVELTGEVGGEVKDLGATTAEITALPDGADHVIKIDFKPDTALAGATVTNLTLTTRIRGPQVMLVQIELDTPASFLTIPALQPAA